MRHTKQMNAILGIFAKPFAKPCAAEYFRTRPEGPSRHKRHDEVTPRFD
ncbi:hypothetical protein [Celeribacter sp.]